MPFGHQILNICPVFRLVARIALVITLMFSIGGHWALVQGAAWAGMFVSFAKHDSVAEAFTKTFDGQHPCKLCKAVESGSHESKQNGSKTPNELKKVDLFTEASLMPDIGVPEQARALSDVMTVHASTRAETPDAPPPRAA